MTKFKILVQKTNKLHKKVVCDSHISHLLPKSLVDLCVVLVCPNLQKLKRRLEKRTYSKKKIRENIDAEIFGVCLSEARQKHHNILEIDVSRKVKREKLVEQILQKRTKKNNSI